MRLPFGRSLRPVIPVMAACLVATASASAAPICRTVLPDGRVILSRPIATQGGLICQSPFVAQTPVSPNLRRGTPPTMGFTTGQIGPFTTGEIGPFTTFSNSMPRSSKSR
jgi:hypothetical protein